MWELQGQFQLAVSSQSCYFLPDVTADMNTVFTQAEYEQSVQSTDSA